MPTATGTAVFAGDPVTGTLRYVRSPDDVLDLMDSGAIGVVALVAEAGATFLAPIFHELVAVVCLSGTPRSHIGIVSREFHIPCLMATEFGPDGPPPDGTTITVDTSRDGVASW